MRKVARRSDIVRLVLGSKTRETWLRSVVPKGGGCNVSTKNCKRVT